MWRYGWFTSAGYSWTTIQGSDGPSYVQPHCYSTHDVEPRDSCFGQYPLFQWHYFRQISTFVGFPQDPSASDDVWIHHPISKRKWRKREDDRQRSMDEYREGEDDL
jgi:hypothetical protein